MSLKSKEISMTWTKTERRRVHGFHVWVIDDIIQRMAEAKPSDFLISSRFRVHDEENNRDLIFSLAIALKGERGYIGLYLRNHNREDLIIQFRYAIQKSDDVQCYPMKENFIIPAMECLGTSKAIFESSLLQTSSKLLKNGSLTLVCNIDVFYDDIQSMGAESKTDFEIEKKSSLGDALGETLESNDFSDVVLLCEDEKFPCHKVILASRSKVFAAMFSHKDTAENQVI